jgi:hypothetical protein
MTLATIYRALSLSTRSQLFEPAPKLQRKMAAADSHAIGAFSRGSTEQCAALRPCTSERCCAAASRRVVLVVHALAKPHCRFARWRSALALC